MTHRAITHLLVVGLILSIIAAIGATVRIIFGFFLGVDWFWGGPLAAYVGVLCFAAALRLQQPVETPAVRRGGTDA